ncbi:MAG: hypothetical protein IJF39_04040 [Clostridia bacterium]|nr:hypothetical protein [Clostridia bacterium]
MKKKLFAAIALTLSTLAFAACAPGNQTLTFYANWEKTIISEANNASEETLTYYVEHEESSFLQKEFYDVKYCYANGAKKAGVYTTSLTYPTEDTYLYQTTLTMDVTFILANGESATKTDTVITEAKFKKTNTSLQPIYSKKTVHAHAPRNGEVHALENVYDAEGKLTQIGAFVEYDYEFLIEYKDDLSGGTLTKTDLSEHGTLGLQDGKQTIEFSIADKKYTYLDNEQYLFALRGISSEQLATASKTVSMYNASLMTMETVATTPSSSAKTNFELQLNGGEKTSYEIEYVPLTVKTNTKHANLSQTLWYAKTTDSNNNLFRNVLLKMSVPMYFGLGTLHYTLQQANFSTEA